MLAAMLPRWFRLLLVVDAALLVASCVLGARLVLDGGHSAGRVITWALHRAPAAIAPATGGAPVVPVAPTAAASATGGAAGPRLGPALLQRLDSDAAASANAQRGLLGMIEEALRRRIVDILEHASGGGGRGP